MINELVDGQRIYSGQFLLADVKKGVTASSKKYLTILLQDATGTIEGKKWDVLPEDEDIFVKGNVIAIDGEVLSYRDQLQMKILAGHPLPQEGIEWSRFVPAAPVSLEVLKAKLDAYLDSMVDPDVAQIARLMVKEFSNRFYSWPAAVRNHHNYVSGLLYHSITMVDLALEVCRVYPSLNRDIVLAGTIIHDMGKTIELSGCQATSFTLEGKLLGHISLGQAELRRIAKENGYFAYDELPEGADEETKARLFKKKEIAVTLEHIILSHHSKPEFGSPLPPLTREALAVAMIDDFDAKMMILDKAFVGVAKGDCTAKIFTMDERYFYLPTYSVDHQDPGLSLDEQKEDLH